MDGDRGDGVGSRVPFVDLPAYTMLTLAVLARRAGSLPADPAVLVSCYMAFLSARMQITAMAPGGASVAPDIANFLEAHPRLARSLARHMARDVSEAAAELASPRADDAEVELRLPVVRMFYTMENISTVAFRQALHDGLVASELVALARGLGAARDPACYDVLAMLLTYMVRSNDEVGVTLLGRGVLETFALAFTLDEHFVRSPPDAPGALDMVVSLVIDLGRRPALRELIRGRMGPLTPTLMMARLVLADQSEGLEAAEATQDVLRLAEALDLPDPKIARNRRLCGFAECGRSEPPMMCAGCRFLRYCDRRCASASVGHRFRPR